MGFFAQVKRSKDKTKLMAQLIDALKNPHDVATIENRLKAFYDYISVDDILSPIISKYDADYDTVKALILKLDEAVGGHYGGWYRNQYIPVSTFGFSTSLECALREYRLGSSVDMILYEVQKLM